MYKIIHGLVDIKINDFLNFTNAARTRGIRKTQKR